jgi:hypothetical protein
MLGLGRVKVWDIYSNKKAKEFSLYLKVGDKFFSLKDGKELVDKEENFECCHQGGGGFDGYVYWFSYGNSSKQVSKKSHKKLNFYFSNFSKIPVRVVRETLINNDKWLKEDKERDKAYALEQREFKQKQLEKQTKKVEKIRIRQAKIDSKDSKRNQSILEKFFNNNKDGESK